MDKELSPAAVTSGRDLALALGWDDRSLRAKTITTGDTALAVARSYIAGEGAAVFAAVTHRNGVDPVESAALYGYHVAGEWGLVADAHDGLTLFNSRWSDEDRWYQLPAIPWTEIKHCPELLNALSPMGLQSGALTRFAEGQKKPTSFLIPVDDALVDRLDRWRDEALKYAKDPDVDGLLQHIYAQLFVLRTVEDRKLDPSVPPISEAVQQGELSWKKWAQIMRAARKHIGGELFIKDDGKRIPPHVLAGVIQDLYRPLRLPGRDSRYNFSWMDADVLGTAYEKYLATILQPGALSPQTDMFLSTEREVARLTVRKKKGAYYTPKYVTSYLATRTVDKYFSAAGCDDPPYVIDFACGSGAFLVAAVDRILHYLNQREPGKPWARELVQSKHVAGIDIDPNAVNLARLRVWQRLLEEPDSLPLPSLADVIIVGDGLCEDTWGGLRREYDIVLGNPPFLVTGKVESRESLESRFATARGRYDFSSLFVEQAIRILRVGGLLGMVVPNRFFRNTNGATLREVLIRQTSLLTVVDFGTTRPFEAHAYVGCIVAEKRQSNAPLPQYVRVIEVQQLDENFLAGQLMAADLGSLPSNGKLRMFQARHPTSSVPWMLLSASDQTTRIHLEEQSIRLDSLAVVAQGIRTGANDFFIFDVSSDDGSHRCWVTNGIGERVMLERDLLEPVIYGAEVQRYGVVQGQKRLLYPYRNGAPLSEVEFAEKYPLTWRYFVSNREFLGARSSLVQSNGRFFELVRPRDEAWLRRPKLLIRDLAPRTSFAIDDTGATFLVGGTAIAPHDSSMLWGLLAYLNSSFVDKYVRQSTPSFQGDYQKFEPKHLQSIPVLLRFMEDADFQASLAELAAEAAAGSPSDGGMSAVERRIDDLVSTAAREASAE